MIEKEELKEKKESKMHKREKAKPDIKKYIPPKEVKVNVYSLKGEVVKQVTLPHLFFEEYRPDLIRRAVKVIRANRRQPYGPNVDAGDRHSVETWGKGRGVARVQRLMGSFRGAQSPGAVGGRRAHPPRVEKIWTEKLNRKERVKARASALAALKEKALVELRGHKFDSNITLPVVVSNEIENIATTKNAIDLLTNVGVYEDVIRACKGTHVHAGKGKLRGRRYHVPKSLLIIVSDTGMADRGFRNLPGVDVIPLRNLNTEDLAPGGIAGRLTLFSENAFEQLSKR